MKKSNKETKIKNASETDCISSEMMSNMSNHVLLIKITNLFNIILDSGYYPETWNHGLFIQYTKLPYNGKKKQVTILCKSRF